MSVIRSSWLLSGVFGFGLVASGCSSGSSAANVATVTNPVVRPKALGPPGKCYYIATPQECASQHATGTPTPMPPVWLATYWPYYTSPTYYALIPADEQVQYAENIGNFASTDSAAIGQDASDGSWVDQDGNTWSGAEEDDPAAESDDGDGGDDGDDGDDGDGGDDGDDGDDGGDDGDDGGDDGGDDDGGDDD